MAHPLFRGYTLLTLVLPGQIDFSYFSMVLQGLQNLTSAFVFGVLCVFDGGG